MVISSPDNQTLTIGLASFTMGAESASQWGVMAAGTFLVDAAAVVGSHDALADCTVCATGKYSTAAKQTSDTCISCAVGKFGKAALKHLKILQTMALEEGVRCEAGITPWFARSFVDGATQAIGVALQRSIVRDQLRRAHLWRSQGDACCDEGYSSSGSDSDGGQGSSVRASSQSSGGVAA